MNYFFQYVNCSESGQRVPVLANVSEQGQRALMEATLKQTFLLDEKKGQLSFFYSCLHYEGWPTVAEGEKDERKEAASLFYSQCRHCESWRAGWKTYCLGGGSSTEP